VVKFEKGPICAAAAIVGYKGALTAVALPHRSPDLGRNVP
jgi:hypothetical protein